MISNELLQFAVELPTIKKSMEDLVYGMWSNQDAWKMYAILGECMTIMDTVMAEIECDCSDFDHTIIDLYNDEAFDDMFKAVSGAVEDVLDEMRTLDIGQQLVALVNNRMYDAVVEDEDDDIPGQTHIYDYLNSANQRADAYMNHQPIVTQEVITESKAEAKKRMRAEYLAAQKAKETQ